MANLLERLVTVSLRHRIGVLVATAALAGAGFWAFLTLNTDAFPDLTPNQVLVMTTVPGLSAIEVEQQVTFPIETAMLGLPGTVSVRSIAKFGLSVVTVTFEDEVDFYFARTQVQQRLQQVIGQLPPGVDPMLGPPATAMGEVFQYLVESTREATDSLTLMDLTEVQEYIVRPLLRTVPGVADVNVWGGMSRQFQVQADPSRLFGYGLTLGDLETAVAANNANFGGGYLEDRGERLTVRGLGRIGTAEDIGRIVVATRQTVPLYVRDIATVTEGPEPRFGAVSRDGRGEAVSATVLMVKGANGRRTVDLILAKLEDIRPLLPQGVRITPFYSQGAVVEHTTRTMFRNLTEGALLVIAVLVLFLRNLRASLLTAAVIPLSLLAAFLAMKWLGFSANLMSLGALDFGLIVDAAVVMVENTVRRRGGSGPAGIDMIRDATLEVARPIAFGVAIIVAVYIPVLTLEGLEGRMFRPMAFTVCAAVLASLILALTFVPAAASLLLAGAAPGRPDVHSEETRWFARLRTAYSGGLASRLGRSTGVIVASVGLLLVALASVPFLGTEFMPQLDEGSLLIETRRLPSASLSHGVSVSAEVERTLLRFPEIRSVVTNLGRPREATETMALFAGDVYVLFQKNSAWNSGMLTTLIPRIDSALSEIPGLDFNFSAPMRMRLDEVISGVRTSLGIKIFGDSLPLLQERAEQVRETVAGIRGAEDVFVATGDGAMQLEFDLDRGAIARYGLNVADLRSTVEMGIGGMQVTEVLKGRRRYPVVVRWDAPSRATPEATSQLLIRTPSGASVTLDRLARIRRVEVPEVIEHDGGQRFVSVQSNVRGRDLGSFVNEVRTAVRNRVPLPSGYYLTYGGQFENQTRALRRFGLIVPLVLTVIAVLLYASLGTLRHALVVMLNVPFALVGGVAALWLSRMPLSLSAAVGFIAVFGVAVLNGVVLVTYMNQLRAGGAAVRDAVRAAAETRLRPVLMTALVASVGFIPMAFSTSAGAEIQRPLARVVMGGLVSSTLLTLLVLPIVYAMMEEWVAARQGNPWIGPD